MLIREDIMRQTATTKKEGTYKMGWMKTSKLKMWKSNPEKQCC